MSPDLDLDLHPKGEPRDADAAQDGLVVRHIPSHIVHKVPDALVSDVGGMVELDGVDVLPGRAGEREGVLHVVEGAVDLLDEVWLYLAGLAVPAACTVRESKLIVSGERVKRGISLWLPYLARLPRSRLLLLLLGCNACSPLRTPRSLGRCSIGDATWLATKCKYYSRVCLYFVTYRPSQHN